MYSVFWITTQMSNGNYDASSKWSTRLVYDLWPLNWISFHSHLTQFSFLGTEQLDLQNVVFRIDPGSPLTTYAPRWIERHNGNSINCHLKPDTRDLFALAQLTWTWRSLTMMDALSVLIGLSLRHIFYD